MLHLATTFVLVLHLLAVNAAAGGPIVCVWLEWMGGEPARRAARYLAGVGLAGLVAGGLLGLVVGWLKWSPQYRDLWAGPLSYKLHWGGAELLFSLGLAIVYWLLVRGRGGDSTAARLGRGAVALLHGTNLLYHFPVLFIAAGKLHAAGQTSGEPIRGAAFRPLMIAGETPALAMHVGLASVAVAGVLLLGLALRLARREPQSAEAATIGAWGGRWALAASLCQLPVGLWTLAVMPADLQSRLMSGDPLGSLLFLASMLSVFWLLRELAAVSLGEATRPVMLRAMTAMLVVVALMTFMQQGMLPLPLGEGRGEGRELREQVRPSP